MKEHFPHLVIKRSIADHPILFDDDWIGKVLGQGSRAQPLPPPTRTITTTKTTIMTKQRTRTYCQHNFHFVSFD